MQIFGVLGNATDEKQNTVIAHEQLFFEDGKLPSNLGFFNDNLVRPDTSTLPYRPSHSRGWDDCLMRKAVSLVIPAPYSLLGLGAAEKYNCQDWAAEVRVAYNMLLYFGSYLSPRQPVITNLP